MTVDPASPRRRFQFRLRTLLLIVAVVAVACWVIVDRQRLIDERDEAVRQRRQVEFEERHFAQELDTFERLLSPTQLEAVRVKAEQPATQP